MILQESGEMYLETIYILTKSNPAVRSIDVGEYMGFSKPSVSRAVGLLREGGYLLMYSDGSLTLTDIGREIAEKIYERHTVISEFLAMLGVDSETAGEDACRIEHVISDTSLNAIKEYLSSCKG